MTTMAAKTGDSDPDEKAVVATQAPTSDESVTSREVATDNEQNQDEDKPQLPFSKARCIALVATVTGASFMNVSCPQIFRHVHRTGNQSLSGGGLTSSYRPLGSKPLSSSYQP